MDVKKKKKEKKRPLAETTTPKGLSVTGYLTCDCLLPVFHSELNPNKAGLFEGSFFRGDLNLTSSLHPSYFKNLSNINITLYNC